MALAMVPPLARLMTRAEPICRAWSKKTHADLTERIKADQKFSLPMITVKSMGVTFLAALAFTALGALLSCGGFFLGGRFIPSRILPALAAVTPLLPLLCLCYLGTGLQRKKRLVFMSAVFVVFVIVILTR
jgi:heme/copper-type cytochrome/quinol oxidase subunit 4